MIDSELLNTMGRTDSPGKACTGLGAGSSRPASSGRTACIPGKKPLGTFTCGSRYEGSISGTGARWEGQAKADYSRGGSLLSNLILVLNQVRGVKG